MENINYDSFYKFLVSLGIFLIICPFLAIIFLCTNSFDLSTPISDLNTYTQTAQRVILFRQSIPLLLENEYVCFFFFICIIAGIILIIMGLTKWYGLQKLDDLLKDAETKKKLNEFNKFSEDMTNTEIYQKHLNDDTTRPTNKKAKTFKTLIIEHNFFKILQKNQVTHILKQNQRIGGYEFDIIALPKDSFDKDYIYEIKYISTNITADIINQYRLQMKQKKITYSDKTNHLPYMILVLIVANNLYEHTMQQAEEAEKWNNWDIQVIKEESLLSPP